jgi:hypothetical protein
MQAYASEIFAEVQGSLAEEVAAATSELERGANSLSVSGSAAVSEFIKGLESEYANTPAVMLLDEEVPELSVGELVSTFQSQVASEVTNGILAMSESVNNYINSLTDEVVEGFGIEESVAEAVVNIVKGQVNEYVTGVVFEELEGTEVLNILESASTSTSAIASASTSTSVANSERASEYASLELSESILVSQNSEYAEAVSVAASTRASESESASAVNSAEASENASTAASLSAWLNEKTSAATSVTTKIIRLNLKPSKRPIVTVIKSIKHLFINTQKLRPLSLSFCFISI